MFCGCRQLHVERRKNVETRRNLKSPESSSNPWEICALGRCQILLCWRLLVVGSASSRARSVLVSQ
eukprot:14054351-Alexandrium_andersonii.AAC.1